jgi:hypothetical protein
MLCGILAFAAGCDKINLKFFNASENGTSSDVTTAVDDSQDNTKIDNNEVSTKDNSTDKETTENGPTPTGEATPTPAAIQPSANIDLPIYTVDAEKGEIVPVTAVIPESSEVTPDLIVDNVVQSLADQSITISIHDVTTKDDAIIVNFSKENPPYKDMGSPYETAILDAIAQSLIDNLDSYNKVIYHVDGGAYVSGVYEFGIDEEYFTR